MLIKKCLIKTCLLGSLLILSIQLYSDVQQQIKASLDPELLDLLAYDEDSFEYKKAYSFMGKEKYKKAIIWFTRSITKNPGAYYSYLHRGVCHRMLNETDKAVTDFKAAIEIDKSETEAYLCLGTTLCRTLKPREAIKYLNTAIKLDPKSVCAYHYLGDAYSQLKMLKKSRYYYEKANELSPNKINNNYLRSIAFVEQEARKIYSINETLRKNPADPKMLLKKGIFLGSHGESEKAVPIFTKLINSRQQLPVAYFQRGMCYYPGLNQYQKAVDDFSMAIKHKDGHAYAYLYRGKALIYLNKPQEAIKDFTKALSFSHNFTDSYSIIDSYMERGETYFDIGQYRNALADFKNVVKLDRHKTVSRFALFDIIILKIFLNEYKQARHDLNQFERLVSFTSNEFEYYFMSCLLDIIRPTPQATENNKKFNELLKADFTIYCFTPDRILKLINNTDLPAKTKRNLKILVRKFCKKAKPTQAPVYTILMPKAATVPVESK